MATSATLIAGSTTGFNAAQTSLPGGTITLISNYALSYTNIFVADYNGDGKADIIADNTTTAVVMLGNGNGTFGAAQSAALTTAQTVYTAAGPAVADLVLTVSGGWSPDVNGDGTFDTLTFNASTAASSVTSVAFQYSFETAAQTYAIGHPVWSNAITDVNGDSLIDLVFLNGDNSISVLLANDPVATPVSASEDTAVAVNLVGYSYNATGTAAMAGFQVSALPANGTLYSDAALTQAITTSATIAGTSGSATVYFKPTLNWNGSTSLSYVVVDASGNTSVTVATQAITVAPVNDAPVLGTAGTLTAGSEDVAYTVSAAQLLQGWSDVDGNTLSVAGNTVSADHGTVTFDAAASTYTITPEANYNGPVVLSYSVSDGTAAVAATQSFTLAGVNDAPVLTGTAGTLNAGAQDSGYALNASDLLAGWSDIDSPTLSVVNLTADHGSIVDNQDGTYSLTPEDGYFGVVTLSYGVSDGSNTANTSLTLNLAFNSVVTASQSYTLPTASGPTPGPTDQVDVSLGGSANINAIGNALDNHLSGNTGNNVLDGGAGSDVLQGGAGNDALLGGASGNDTLDGGTGNDWTAGGLGDDVYFIDSQGDVIIEKSAQGIDTVHSSISCSLGANVEHLQLEQTGGAIRGYGNELDNHLTGNASDNSLLGGAGNDIQDGGAGNDFIVGGLGADAMSGGLGDDTYGVDNASDMVVENAGEGTDTVIAAISYTLGANLENLTLHASGGAVSGSGNELNNVLTGNASDNLLSGAAGNDALLGGAGNDTLGGGTGNDWLAGGTGNDTYQVDSQGDVIIEQAGQGTDTVIASVSWVLGANVENLTLDAAGGAIQGYGNALDNVLIGNASNNVLVGGAGNDTLTGGQGQDLFVFNAAANAATNVDTITDFATGVDHLMLDHNVYTSLSTIGASVQNGGGLSSVSSAATFLAFDTSTGNLYYDADGAGVQAGVLVANLSGLTHLSSSDVWVA